MLLKTTFPMVDLNFDSEPKYLAEAWLALRSHLAAASSNHGACSLPSSQVWVSGPKSITAQKPLWVTVQWWFSERVPWTSYANISQESAGQANSQAPPRTC